MKNLFLTFLSVLTMTVLLTGCKTLDSNGFGFGTHETKDLTPQVSSNQVEAKAQADEKAKAKPEYAEVQEQQKYENLRQIVWKSSVRQNHIADETPGLIRTFDDKTGYISSVAFSPDGRYALTGGLGGFPTRLATSYTYPVKLWDISTGRQVRSFDGHKGNINSVAFSPDGRYALTGSEDKTAKLWEVSSGRQVRSFEGHTDDVNSVAFSPDGRYALTGSKDKTAKLWEVSTGRQVRSFDGHTSYIKDVAFSPDSRYALTGSGEKTAKLWEVSSGRQVRTFGDNDSHVNDVAFSPDGKYALTGNGDNTAKLWEVSTGRQVRSFDGHTSYISSVAFSPNGKYALTGSGDNTAKLWEVSTGRQVNTFEGYTSFISSVAFSPNGRYVLTGGAASVSEIARGQNNTAKLWVSSTKRGFNLVAEFSDEELSIAIANSAGAKPTTQDKFESRETFRQRVEAYNTKVRDYPRWWRNRAVEKAFYRVFGAPRVTDAQYDSESSTFTVDITSDSNLASNFQHRFTLTDPIPNNEAETFDKQLRNAALEVRFGFNNGKFSLASATFQINAQSLAALPSGGSFKPVLLATARPGEVAQPDPTATEYGADPEIVKQELELKRLRKKQAAVAELKRIQGEIAKITPTLPKKITSSFPSKPINVNFPSSQPQPNDIAVIIGNADYEKGKDIPNVTPAYADAAGIKRYVKKVLGVREENIIFLKDATLAKMTATFGSDTNPRGQLFNYVKAGKSRVFIYYSGHGAPGGENGGSYIVPSDAQASLIELNGYLLKTLYKNLSKIPAKSVKVVLEACFSGTSQGGTVIAQASPINIQPKKTYIPSNITVIAAGAANQIASWERDSSSGLFTKYFLKGMSGEADAKPYGNDDGKVDYNELGRYFKETMTYYARRYYGREQTVQIVVGR